MSRRRSIELGGIERGNFFRLIADVWIDGRSLAAALIQAGLGRPYAGGKRQGWCDADAR